MINYNKLKPGMIIGTTQTFDVVSSIIRATEAGIGHILDTGIANHVLTVCSHNDLLYGMEMAGRNKLDTDVLPDDQTKAAKIRRVDLKDYTDNKLGNHIVFVADPYVNFSDQENRRKSANTWLWQSHAKGILYDYIEVLDFWGLKANDPTKLICSDLVREMLKATLVPYPDNWNHLVSPFDIQRYFTAINQLVGGVYENNAQSNPAHV